MRGDYRVEVLPSARRELESLRDPMLARVAGAIAGLSENPRPRGCRKLSRSDSDYRIRVGDFRVLYEFLEAERVVRVYRVRHRSRA